VRVAASLANPPRWEPYAVVPLVGAISDDRPYRDRTSWRELLLLQAEMPIKLAKQRKQRPTFGEKLGL